jgi:streptogramin lyase
MLPDHTRGGDMRRSTLLVVAVALLVLPAAAGLAGGKTGRPSNPRVSGPRNTTNQSPVYRFSARERGVPSTAIRFRCGVDSAPLQACARRYHAHLTVGSHVLAVLAVDRKGRKSHTVRVRITVTKPLPAGAQVVATIQMPERADPAWIAADASNVWVHQPDHVVRVSTSSNTIVAQISTPSIQYGYMATGAGAVWQANFAGASLLRIDPTTNTVAATIPLGGEPEGVAVTDGAIWVAEHAEGTVLRIDPTTNAIVKTINVGPAGSSGPLEMTAGAAAVWVNVPNENRVVHIDPSTNTVAGYVDESGQPIVDGTSVWIETGSGLDRIDPATDKVITHIALPGPNAWGAAGLGSVWVTTAFGLARVDEATNRLVGLLPNMPTADIAVTAGSVWLAAYGDTRLLRVKPVG